MPGWLQSRPKVSGPEGWKLENSGLEVGSLEEAPADAPVLPPLHDPVLPDPYPFDVGDAHLVVATKNGVMPEEPGGLIGIYDSPSQGVTWSADPIAYAFPAEPDGSPNAELSRNFYTGPGSDFWANEAHPLDGHLFLVGAGRRASDRRLTGFISVAESYDGHYSLMEFEVQGQRSPYLSHERFPLIDFTLFKDPVGGQQYLAYKIDANDPNSPGGPGDHTSLMLVPVELDVANKVVRLLEEPREILKNDQPWEEDVVEAPTLFYDRASAYYYLLYAGNNFSTDRYGIGAARSRDLLHWEKSDGPIFNNSHPLLGPDLVGAGHPMTKESSLPDAEGLREMNGAAWPRNLVAKSAQLEGRRHIRRFLAIREGWPEMVAPWMSAKKAAEVSAQLRDHGGTLSSWLFGLNLGGLRPAQVDAVFNAGPHLVSHVSVEKASAQRALVWLAEGFLAHSRAYDLPTPDPLWIRKDGTGYAVFSANAEDDGREGAVVSTLGEALSLAQGRGARQILFADDGLRPLVDTVADLREELSRLPAIANEKVEVLLVSPATQPTARA